MHSVVVRQWLGYVGDTSSSDCYQLEQFCVFACASARSSSALMWVIFPSRLITMPVLVWIAVSRASSAARSRHCKNQIIGSLFWNIYWVIHGFHIKIIHINRTVSDVELTRLQYPSISISFAPSIRTMPSTEGKFCGLAGKAGGGDKYAAFGFLFRPVRQKACSRDANGALPFALAYTFSIPACRARRRQFPIATAANPL